MKPGSSSGRLIKAITLFLIALYGGCSLQTDQEGNKWKEMPKDLQVVYEWFSGTVAPPDQYRYMVEIGPGVRGRIVFGPTSRFGLEGPVVEDEPQPWTETFSVDEEGLKQLFELMSKSGVFGKRLKEAPDNEKVAGGMMQSMRVEGDGVSVMVPTSLKSADMEAVKKVYDAIESLVPRELWTKLESQRQRYVEDYEIHKH